MVLLSGELPIINPFQSSYSFTNIDDPCITFKTVVKPEDAFLYGVFINHPEMMQKELKIYAVVVISSFPIRHLSADTIGPIWELYSSDLIGSRLHSWVGLWI